MAYRFILIGQKAVVASGYHRTITINHTLCGSASSTNFPVLVSATDATLKSVANGGHVNNTSGKDILFYSDSGFSSLLNWEIDFYDPVNGILDAWVNIPTVSSSVDTNFYLVYGSATTYTGGATATWDNNYKGIWHLGNGATLSVSDSTGLNTSVNHGATAYTGQIDGGASFSNNAYIDSGSTLGKSYTGLCAQCWFYVASSGAASTALGTFNGNSDMSFDLDIVNGSTSQMIGNILVVGNSRVNMTQTGTNAIHTWVLAHLTWDGTTFTLYKNGIKNISTAAGVSGANLSTTQTKNFVMGAYQGGSGFQNMIGMLDEVRISNIARSKDWIFTEYNNQNSPGNIGSASFLSYSGEY